MKLKLLFLLAAIGAVSGAAWGVNRLNTTIVVDAEGPRQLSGANNSLEHEVEPDVPEKYRATVTKGLEFLIKNQCADGHWEGDDGKHPVAMTGLVGIALLAERDARGSKFGAPRDIREGQHPASINKAVDWLLEQGKIDRDGLIFSDHPSETSRYMEGHGLATMFLAGVCKDTSDKVRRKKISDVLTRAVKYIGKAQSSQGGWYHTSRVEGHDFDSVQPTTIQIQALQAADRASTPLQGETLASALSYITNAQEKYHADKKLHRERDRLVDSAQALACRFNRIETDEWTKDRRKSAELLNQELSASRKIQFGSDERIYYYHAQAMFTGQGKAWTQYRDAVFAQVQAAQDKDGGWPSSVGISAGRVYATALWCTVLQLERENYPSMRRQPVIVD